MHVYTLGQQVFGCQGTLQTYYLASDVENKNHLLLGLGAGVAEWFVK